MISQVRWIREHGTVRNYLAEKFKLPVGIGSEMVGGVLVSDGRTPKQLYEAFSVKNLQEFTGSKSTDVYELFEIAVEIAKEELNPKHEKSISKKNASAAGSEGDVAGTDEQAGKGKRRGRKKKSGDVVAATVPQE